ncbi:sigmaY antisigma factor component [Paenibacillus macquariensis subsp. defensor]|nr:sigmaY antisigma factor component [Paenibacillus macquariensis subsp. defensor]
MSGLELKGVPIWLIVTLLPILLVQGTWLFLDAGKRGKYRWLWGLWGLTSTPTPLLIYLFFVWLPNERKKSHERKDD